MGRLDSLPSQKTYDYIFLLHVACYNRHCTRISVPTFLVTLYGHRVCLFDAMGDLTGGGFVCLLGLGGQYSDRVRARAKAKQLDVVYGSLLVATGSSVRFGVVI